MKKLRFGMIGTGGISHRHARQLLELGDEADIAAVSDPNGENREKFLKGFGLANAAGYADADSMLEEAELDAVVICSPHTLHFRQAKAALERGLHVLVEKPMTCSSEEARQLASISERAGKVLQISYQRHFQPEFLYIKEAIASGVIGPLSSVTVSLFQDWTNLASGTWRQQPEWSGGGMLMDSGSHVLDILLWTTGMTPKEVRCQLHRQRMPVEIDSFTSIVFAEGPIAGVNIVGKSHKFHETYVFCGEEGCIHMSNQQVVLWHNEKESRPSLPARTANQDSSFVDTIRGRRENPVPAEFGLKVVRLTEMIYEAAGYDPLGSSVV